MRSLGGAWLATHAVDVADPKGTRHALVLRRWARADWRETDPDMTPEREAAILDRLEHAEFPAPRLVAVDAAAVECDLPALLETRLTGRPPGVVTGPVVDELARVAARIHQVDVGGQPAVPVYRPYYEPSQGIPTWARRIDLWERAIRVVSAPPPPDPGVFIHRDYHPGNTLWSGGRFVGVVDWLTGSRGSPGVDIGHMRWNLVADHGVQAAAAFLARHREIGGPRSQAQTYWDLRMLLDATPDLDGANAPPEPARARFENYVAALVSEIS